MSDKVFVGQHISDLDIGEKPARISRITIIVDSDHQYTAGDDTGRTLEKTVPWGSQEMANAILAAVKDYDYQPFTGTDALLNPAAEIGDGITTGGIYSVLAQKDVSFGGLTTSNISAPGSDEINDEYPYISKAQRQANRQLAQTRSLITKSAEEIKLSIEATDGRVSELQVTLDGVTVTDGSGTTRIKGSSIETGSIAAGSIRADQINLTGAITWGDLDSGVQGDINNRGISESRAKTLITDELVSSPTIEGGIFYNSERTAWFDLVPRWGNANWGFAYFSLNWNSNLGQSTPVFGVYDTDFGETTFDTKGYTMIITDVTGNRMTARPQGTWDFSGCTVRGITAVFG